MICILLFKSISDSPKASDFNCAIKITYIASLNPIIIPHSQWYLQHELYSTILQLVASSVVSKAIMVCFTLLVLALLCSQVTSEEYIIITPEQEDCSSCNSTTLSNFATHVDEYVSTDNITLLLLPGTHNLTVDLTIYGINLTMTSMETPPEIVCEYPSHFDFYYSSFVHVSNVMFKGCKGNQVHFVDTFILQDVKFDGQGTSDMEQVMDSDIELHSNYGTGLELIRTNARIIRTHFSSFRQGSLREIVLYRIVYSSSAYQVVDNQFASIGGAIIADNSIVNITQSEFTDNRAQVGGALFVISSHVFIDNTSFIENEDFWKVHLPQEGTCDYYDYYYSEFDDYYYHDCPGIGTIAAVLYQVDSNTVITDSKFSTNRALTGGCIAAIRGNLNITSSMFDNNQASLDCGCIIFTIQQCQHRVLLISC